MKKTAKTILILLAVLAVLGGGLAALLLLPGEGEEASSSSAAESSSAPGETVMDRDKEDVASVSVKNQKGSYVLVPGGEGFTVEGYEDYELNNISVSDGAESLLSLEASKNLGSRDDLEEFGLAGESAVEVELQYKDGSSDQLVLGNTAGETSGRYLLKDGTVYIVSGVSEFLYKDVYSYFNITLYTVADRIAEAAEGEESSAAQAEEDILYNLKLSGTQFPEPVEIEYTDKVIGGYRIVTPIVAESGSDTFMDIMEDLKTLTADCAVAAKLTPELLKEFGLDEPAAVAEFDMNNEQHTLTVSAASDGVRYLTLDDRDVIYQVSGDAVTSWADATLMKLRLSYIFAPMIMNVEKLSLTVDGDMAYRYDITRTVNEEDSTEDNVKYDLFPKNAGGKDIDYKVYQKFYTKLISIAVLSTDKTAYEKEPAFRVEYTYFDGAGSDVIEFFPAGDDRYAVEFNGGFNGLVRKSEADKVMGLLPDVDANKPVE